MKEPVLFDVFQYVEKRSAIFEDITRIRSNAVMLTLQYLKDNGYLSIDSDIEKNCPFKYVRFGDECCESDCSKVGITLCIKEQK